MSDSGVEFTTAGLPLDSDTDAAMTYASHKPLLNAISPTAVTGEVHSDSLEATVAPLGDLSASRTPDSAMSASPASNPRSLAAATPDGSLRSAASPGTASRGTAGSDSAKTEAGAESGEGGQKEESAQSTWEDAPECVFFFSSWSLYSNDMHNHLALCFQEPYYIQTTTKSLITAFETTSQTKYSCLNPYVSLA